MAEVALELATPTQYDGPGTDGITGRNFAGLIVGARDATLLLDPWSRVKAVGFSAVKDAEETMRVLDAAWVDIGHRPGKAYTVALTRPLGPRRAISTRGSLGSAGSSRSAGTRSTGTGSSESLSVVDQSDPSEIAELPDALEAADRGPSDRRDRQDVSVFSGLDAGDAPNDA